MLPQSVPDLKGPLVMIVNGMRKPLCLLCRHAARYLYVLPNELSSRVDCRACGIYDVTPGGQAFLRTLSSEDRTRLSLVTRAAANHEGRIIELSEEQAAWLLHTSPVLQSPTVGSPSGK
jgi:hypothetical protein